MEEFTQVEDDLMMSRLVFRCGSPARGMVKMHCIVTYQRLLFLRICHYFSSLRGKGEE